MAAVKFVLCKDLMHYQKHANSVTEANIIGASCLPNCTLIN